MTVVVDPQAVGWEDTGTEQGVLRAKILQGRLVDLPIRAGTWTAQPNGNTSPQVGNVPSNEDGSASALNITVPAGLSQSAVVLFQVWGPVIGVRWRRDGAAANFTVWIDGETYGVTGAVSGTYPNGYTFGGSDPEARMIVAENLGNGPHSVMIEVNGAAGSAQSLLLYGFLVDARLYQGKPRLGQFTGPVTLGIAATEINTNRAGINEMRGWRGVLYVNTSGAAVTVTVKYNTIVVWQSTIAAGGVDRFDLLVPVMQNSLWTHLASAATSINATVIGGA